MRILIYAFGPYGQFQENITARIVKSLAPRPGLKKEVFPVRFRRSQYIDALKRHKPDIVLGMGQCERESIEIETRAANRKRAKRGAPVRVISKRGRLWLPTTLTIGRSVPHSKSAGDYVCNYSMYVIIEHLLRHGSDAQFGFVHIPFDHDPAEAQKVIEMMIRQVTTLSKKRGRTNI